MPIEEIIGRDSDATELFVAHAPPTLSGLGSIALIADFSELPESNRYLGAIAAATSKRAYYTGTDHNPQQSFIRALRETNEALAREAQQGTAQWIGTIRMLVIAVAGDTLFLSSTGGCIALLLRNGTVNNIPLSAGEGSRPFGTLTLGKLDPADTVLAASRVLLTIPNAQELFARDSRRFFLLLKKSPGCACLSISLSPPTSLQRTSFFRSILPAAFLRIAARLPFPSPSKVKSAVRTYLETVRVHFSRIPAKKRIPIVLAAIVIALISLSFFSRNHQNIPVNDSYTTAIGQARHILDQSDADVILGNTASALSALTQGISALDAFPQDADARALRQQLQDRRDSIAGISAADTPLVVDLQGFPFPLADAHIAVVESDGQEILALASPSHAAVWLHEIGQSRDGTFVFLPSVFSHGITGLVQQETSARVLAITQDGIASIDTVSKTALPIIAEAFAHDVLGISGGNNASYLTIVPQAHLALSFGIGADGTPIKSPTAWDTDALLAHAIDITADDTNAFALLDDSTFLRLSRGSKDAHYRIEGLGWQGSARALLALPDGTLAVLDDTNGRLLVTNKQGDVTHQFTSPVFSHAHDLALDVHSHTVFILGEHAVFRMSLPQ